MLQSRLEREHNTSELQRKAEVRQRTARKEQRLEQKHGRHLSLICMFKLSYRILNRIIWIKEMVLGGDTVQYHFYGMLIR